MQEYFEGVRVIQHDDGSTTHITYEHEPQFEPLTKKEQATLFAFILLTPVVAIGIPVALEKMIERSDRRRSERKRQKINKEIFDQLPS